MRHAGPLACLLSWTLTMSGSGAGAGSPLADQARLEPLSFKNLAGWEEDDHAAAFQAFLRSCRRCVVRYSAPPAGVPLMAPDELDVLFSS